jgi:hypothetical protein
MLINASIFGPSTQVYIHVDSLQRQLHRQTMRMQLLSQRTKVLRSPVDLNLLDRLAEQLPVFLSLKIHQKCLQALQRLPTFNKRAMDGFLKVAV